MGLRLKRESIGIEISCLLFFHFLFRILLSHISSSHLPFLITLTIPFECVRVFRGFIYFLSSVSAGALRLVILSKHDLGSVSAIHRIFLSFLFHF